VSWSASCARRSIDFDFNSYIGCCRISLTTTFRLLFRYPQGRPLLRGERGDGFQTTSAAPIARCWTIVPCSVRWLARCSCSRPRRSGEPRFPDGGSVTARMAAHSRVPADDGRWAKLRELRRR
jgi:hypothetical protein